MRAPSLKSPTRSLALLLGFFILLSLFGSLSIFYFTLDWESQAVIMSMAPRMFPFLAGGTLGILTLFFTFHHYIYQSFIYPVEKIREEIEIVTKVNPRYRIEPEGAKEVKELIIRLNEFLDAGGKEMPLPERQFSLDGNTHPLTNQEFVVFDTETTGLNPSQGDEIISIGAVRIKNGKIIETDVFNKLVDPRRKMSKESIAIHGIKPEMLIGQPSINVVLPWFRSYVGNAVLVAHNGAFDMRFMQMKQATSGIHWDEIPLLDTLIISGLLHPKLEEHSLDKLAERAGIDIEGRHTALGDAMMTAEIFLQYLKLLQHREYKSVEEVLKACQEGSRFARVRY